VPIPVHGEKKPPPHTPLQVHPKNPQKDLFNIENFGFFYYDFTLKQKSKFSSLFYGKKFN
jgi:hypothetical protein